MPECDSSVVNTLMSIDVKTQNSHQARPVGVRATSPDRICWLYGTVEPDCAELLFAAIAHIDVCDTDTVLS